MLNKSVHQKLSFEMRVWILKEISRHIFSKKPFAFSSQSVRADVIDGSDILQTTFRVVQCDAFNAIMALICRLQNQEKFYSNIFKEEPSKAEYIWWAAQKC